MDKSILEILICPLCSGDVNYIEKTNIIFCKNCQKGYSIKEDIPIMLEEEPVNKV